LHSRAVPVLSRDLANSGDTPRLTEPHVFALAPRIFRSDGSRRAWRKAGGRCTSVNEASRPSRAPKGPRAEVIEDGERCAGGRRRRLQVQLADDAVTVRVERHALRKLRRTWATRTPSPDAGTLLSVSGASSQSRGGGQRTASILKVPTATSTCLRTSSRVRCALGDTFEDDGWSWQVLAVATKQFDAPGDPGNASLRTSLTSVKPHGVV
jgi:hypothetical protein